MVDIIFKAADYAELLADAERLGFTSEAPATEEGEESVKTIITHGTFESGGGWFLNIVGTVYEPIVGEFDIDNPPTPVARDGYWGRLRLNGTPQEMPQFSSDITQYYWSQDVGPKVDGIPSGGWTADGKKLAPEWVGSIGMIA